jgi:hypothetical protein
MMKIVGVTVLAFLLSSSAAFASALWPTITSPIGWMHELPSGDFPGWTAPSWVSAEYSVSNIWNIPMDFINTKTGKTLHYFADFEQQDVITEMGFQLAPKFALIIEVPYAWRDGGSLDRFLDWWHRTWGANRFEREIFPQDQSIFQVQTNGLNQLTTPSASGFSNIRLKAKYWAIKSGEPDQCACGLGAEASVKVPVDSSRDGLTSGSLDFSFMLHGGIPVGKLSAIELTAGMNVVPVNVVFADWPRNTVLQLFEASGDFDVGKKFGVIAQIRAESPFMDRDSLTIHDAVAVTHENFLEDRLSSAYNGLVYWRIHETLGVRYKFNNHDVIALGGTEDGGPGDLDETGDTLYGNNSPDILFFLKFQITI